MSDTNARTSWSAIKTGNFVRQYVAQNNVDCLHYKKDRPMTFEWRMLIECRKVAGWTQQQLADKSGCHVRCVKYWEARNKVRAVKGNALERMRDVLAHHGVTPDQLPELRRMAALKKQKEIPLYCGAMTRKGNPCMCKTLPGKRRCKFHGGMSTGAKTPEGRERIRQAQYRRWNRTAAVNDSTNAP